MNHARTITCSSSCHSLKYDGDDPLEGHEVIRWEEMEGEGQQKKEAVQGDKEEGACNHIHGGMWDIHGSSPSAHVNQRHSWASQEILLPDWELPCR